MSPGSLAAPVDLTLPINFRMALREATGAQFDPSLAATLSQREGATRSSWADWKEALKDQFESSGVLSRGVNLGFDEACGLLRRGTPLVTYVPEMGWLALLDREKGKIRVMRPGGPMEWVNQAEMANSLSASFGDETPEWVVLETGFFGGAGGAKGGDAQRNGDSTGSGSGNEGGPLTNLLRIVHPERSEIIAIILYAAFTGLLTLAIPVAVQQLVNTVAFGGLVQPVVILALLLLAGLVIAGCLYAFQAYLAELLQQRIFVRGCLDLAHRLPRVHQDGFGSKSAPAYVNRFFDLVTVQKSGSKLLLDGSGVILQAATGLLVLSFYHPLMLALSIFLLGAMVVVAYSFGRGAPGTAIRESYAKYDLAAWMEELVRHPTTFRTSAGRRRAESKADALVASWVNARRHHYRIVFRQFLAALGLQALVNTGLLALGGFLVVTGELTLGQLVASEIIVASVVASFARLAKQFETYYDLLAAVEKVSDLFDLPLEDPPQGRDVVHEPGSVALGCQEIGLTGPNGPILRDVSFRLEPGERVALVGPSGSGKGQLVDVLAGLRSADAGYVTLNERDLRDQSAEATRDTISLIRTPQILPSTLLNNLTIVSTDATLEDVENALDQVGLLEEIRRYPNGLQTWVNETGAPLSRSQAVRLEIARALLSRPAIILVDFQTVDLEDESMQPALNTLLDPAQDWTLLCVTSSGPLTARCDRVLRIEAGEVVEGAIPSARPEEGGAV
ncbi:MAG: peptidase domain-containing ABC transporter [Myxococcota bacterium]